MNAGNTDAILKGPFEGTVESLQNYRCPDWFRNAKFGIWSHWGPQSVPMYGDWYARNMYIEGSDQYRYHCRVFGHPSKFGYKDIVKLWKAEKFDPAALMDLYVETGARYFVAQAMHHDNFDNFDSAFNPWNATKMGPMKDICTLWKKEALRVGLPFGVTEHLAASYTWFAVSHGHDLKGPYAGIPYDGADPANGGLYRDNDSELLDDGGAWYTVNPKYQADWFRRIRDLIDKLQPDFLYSDGELPFHDIGFQAVAHLYNTSAKNHGGVNQAVYTFKQHQITDYTENITKIGVLDVERGVADAAAERPWQDDTSLGDWFYNVRDVYKSHRDIADTLVDVVSKNGNLLMNVTQRPDGTLDDETVHTLKLFGAWMKDNADGIYDTRPYVKTSEGRTRLSCGPFQEAAATWTDTDYRFTQNGKTVYAFRMRSGKNQARIISLGRIYAGEASSVTVYNRPVGFSQQDGCLLVDMPENRHPDMPACIAVRLK
jgi:alpha-L-fucosidase